MIAALNTLVVVALAGTLVVLFAGVFAMARGGEFNRKWGNKLMRARVATQGLAILLLLALFLLNQGWIG
ncbi:MAG: twin transmembrane helix small protein [Alphaproteobacteria bacterium]